MKLLIVTQKVDRNDPILGFFHGWIAEIAKHCEKVTVIGQLVGDYNLPENVLVESLGKEKGKSRIAQVMRFWKLQWKLSKEYDKVLVHMTPIWVVMGNDFWTILRKPRYLWYEARGKRWPLRLSLICVRKVFSASASGMPIRTKKNVVVGHGIDTERFVPGGERDKGSLVTVGRITRSKHLDVILYCLKQLPETFRLRIVGSTITADDEKLRKELEDQIARDGLQDRVTIASCTQEELIPLLQKAEVFLHASETSLDKAVLEAMACGCPVVSCSEATRSVLPEQCVATPETLANTVQDLLSKDQSALRKDLRNRIEKDHSLKQLAERLVKEMTS